MNLPVFLLWRLLVLAGLLVAMPAQAQRLPPDPLPSSSELESICRSEPCRRNQRTQVRLADGRIQEESADLYRPQVRESSVSVLIGEEVEVAAEFRRDEFAGWRVARQRENSRTPVLRIQLAQEDDGSMAAAIGNTGRSAVKIDLYLRAPGSGQYEYTSTCPIPPGSTVYEYWNQAVVELQVRSLRALPDDAAHLCD